MRPTTLGQVSCWMARLWRTVISEDGPLQLYQHSPLKFVGDIWSVAKLTVPDGYVWQAGLTQRRGDE